MGSYEQKSDKPAGYTLIISLIWAQDENGLIGSRGKLPWHLPADMAWFRRQTMGKPVLMGRKTHASIGRPLPGRTNLILTRQQDYSAPGCMVVHSMHEAKNAVPDAEEIMVIGGAAIYALALPEATRLYKTCIHTRFDGDRWFPEFDRNSWIERSSEHHKPGEQNPAYSFIILDRALQL